MKVPQRRRKSSQVGDKNPNWRGGRFISSQGYVWLYKPDHPYSSRVSPKGYILEHRYIMELTIGRYLNKNDVVHHINGIRDDNRKENLVLTTNSQHTSKHNKLRVWKESSRHKQKIKTDNMKRNSNGQFAKKEK